MGIDTQKRTDAVEIMDDFSLKGQELTDALDKIAKINRLLGGNRLTLQGVQELIKLHPEKKDLIILDAGCGNGDMLRALSKFARRNGRKFRMIGVDANAFTIEYARELSVDYPEIEYLCEDFFSETFSSLKADILLCTLTLHHFKDQEIIRLLQSFQSQASIGIVVNDLHRNLLAYRLFQIISVFFHLNRMSRNDGLVSILRGFKKYELGIFSRQLNLKNYKIQWKWAFRYQWIISKV